MGEDQKLIPILDQVRELRIKFLREGINQLQWEETKLNSRIVWETKIELESQTKIKKLIQESFQIANKKFETQQELREINGSWYESSHSPNLKDSWDIKL